MNNAQVYKHAENCLLEDMDGETLLYNPANATTLHLNGPSAIVWQLCDGERSVQTIIDAVKEAYPDQAEQVEGDIINVVKDLSTREVLVLVE